MHDMILLIFSILFLCVFLYYIYFIHTLNVKFGKGIKREKKHHKHFMLSEYRFLLGSYFHPNICFFCVCVTLKKT